ncbi:MAG TPA: glycosyltransferase [Gemmatimonadales bacterium]|nr:glycosyltransferase [Gemmatimonadales bacterium]
MQISILIPARNEARNIGRTLAALRAQQLAGIATEIIVVDDGSSDATALVAAEAGAKVIAARETGGNPGAARNRGAAAATGEVLVFLDADCVPRSGWLEAHVAAHAAGKLIVGGALGLPPGLPWSARCDYYASAYHVHPGRPAGRIRNHTPANLSVQREVFDTSGGFTEEFPVADGHEELEWEGQAARQGVALYFEPAALADHYNRPSLGNFFRRHYRWGYSALEAKYLSAISRGAVLYRFPLLALLVAYPVAFLESGYIMAIWILAGRPQALLFSPLILGARLAYATAFVAGGWKWLRRKRVPGSRSPWR